MNSTSAANSNSKNASGSSTWIVPSKAEGIAWCSAFILASVFIVVGNLLTIVLFAVNKRLRKKCLFLVINMAFADLMLGALSLPSYIYIVGADSYELWTGNTKVMNMLLDYINDIVDNVPMVASLISAVFISGERFYAIYWPFNHRTLSMRAYRIVIVMVWILALFDTGLIFLISYKHYVYVWMSYGLFLTFIICGCNIGIWRKFQHGDGTSQQQNRTLQNKRLTKTLVVVSIITLLSWLPLIIINGLSNVLDFSIPWRHSVIASILNYSNSFVNPIVYALRIPEFRQALGLCCYRRQAVMNMEHIERRNNRAVAETPMAQLTTSQTDPIHLQLAFKLEVMDTKL